MRHGWTAAGVALGAALALSLGMKDWSINPARLRGDLAGALVRVEAPSAISLRLLPRPTLHIVGLRFHIDGGALSGAAERAQATLRVGRLLLGAFAPASLTLEHADLRIDLDAAERSMADLSASSLARLNVEGGRVEVVSALQSFSTHADLDAARLDWASADGPLSLSASGRWREQPTAVWVRLANPLSAAHGGASPLTASLSAAALARFDVEGDWAPRDPDGATYRGRITALVPSLERFGRWMDLDPPPGPIPAGLELSARLGVEQNIAKFADADIKLGGQPFEGDFDARRTPAGVSISGTLAADALDLAALIGPTPELLDAAGAWSSAPMMPAPIPGLDLDLRVSATYAAWGGRSIDNVAAAVSQRDGRFVVTLLDCGFANGALTGEASIEAKDGAFLSRLALSLENADLGALATQFRVGDLAGEGEFKLAVQARGRSPAEIAATLDGQGSLTIADGVLRHINFEEGLRRAQRRLIDVGRDLNAGDTRFGEARGRVEISDGEARFVGVETKAPGVELSLSGAVDLKGRALRARLTARQSDADGAPTPDGAHIDFALSGPWSAPAFSPLIPPAD